MGFVRKPSRLATIIIFVTIACVNNMATAADLVDGICSRSQTPAKCAEILRSDPRSATADLHLLGTIAIEKATTNAKEARDLMNSLSGGAATPQAKSTYTVCQKSYDNAIYELGRCLEFLNAKDYGGLDSFASGALDSPVTCDESFKEMAVTEPDPLKAASVKLQGYCDVILLVSSKLSGRVLG